MQSDKEDLEISSLEDMVTYFSKQRNFFIRELGFISYDTFFINAVIVRAYQLNKGFISLVSTGNYLCACPLVRIQLETVLSLWASLIADGNYTERMLLGKSVDKSKHNGNYLSNSYLVSTLCEFTNLSLKELWDKGNNYLHPSYSSISKTIHRENNQIILENLECNLSKSDLEQLTNEMLEINLAYIPILKEYKDILSKIVKQLIFK